MPTYKLLLLPGDGIGAEVITEVEKVAAALARTGLASFEFERGLVGGCAYDAHGQAISDTDMALARAADAVLLGAVGGPQWDGGAVRPEQGLLALRKALDVYANLRPAAQGDVDLVIVRELVGGLYFGARGVREDGTVFDTLEYHPVQIERVARRAFELARTRRGELVSVDKANVLDTSRLWRRVVGEVGVEYPDVRLSHALVDSAAMEIVTDPARFDVIVTENTFGDILSDIAAAVTGGLGVASSASLGDGGPGIFEPVHGSAPDIAGRGIANPTAMLRSLALCLEHSLGRADLARCVEQAVAAAIASTPTPDLGGAATTSQFTESVLVSLAPDEAWAAESR
jgi:3-isopropylmalate dehydrogenase